MACEQQAHWYNFAWGTFSAAEPPARADEAGNKNAEWAELFFSTANACGSVAKILFESSQVRCLHTDAGYIVREIKHKNLA